MATRPTHTTRATRATTRPRVIVTGFEPFGGRRGNRSMAAVRLLATETRVATQVLPVSFALLRELVPPLVDGCGRALILVGESGKAKRPTLERVAINLAEAALPDNSGVTPRGPVLAHGPAAYFATWPAARLLERLREAGHDAELSAHAGTFACNAALYLALHRAAELRRPPRVGFLHVPARRPFADNEKVARLLRFLVEELA